MGKHQLEENKLPEIVAAEIWIPVLGGMLAKPVFVLSVSTEVVEYSDHDRHNA
jgi:hypothetical protein